VNSASIRRPSLSLANPDAPAWPIDSIVCPGCILSGVMSAIPCFAGRAVNSYTEVEASIIFLT